MTVQELERPAPSLEGAVQEQAEKLGRGPGNARRGAAGRLRQSALARRVARYAGTSVASTVVSEALLLFLFGTRLAGAAPAAVIATVAGGMLSYILSRYWIWSEADRGHPGRQLVLYWTITVVGLLASTWATEAVASHTTGSGAVRTGLVGAAYLATYVLLWAVKFGLYSKLLFRNPSARPGPSRLTHRSWR
ncbi:MAG: GtrA family protein [Candidatus Dormibacteria bacterium]